ncbi:Ubiquitin [Hexamita inflata]|uniref:Ubiquitin n=1 Tax=Hexamita inflata TaxID=28002 RepID=A0AA86Q555_9EUKA|nr:Ubiquitin [Hexamita inflata]
MKIFVKTLACKNITLDVEPTDTIQNLKGKIQDQEAIPAHYQELLFYGRLLMDTETLSHCKIQNEATLLLLKLQ